MCSSLRERRKTKPFTETGQEFRQKRKMRLSVLILVTKTSLVAVIRQEAFQEELQGQKPREPELPFSSSLSSRFFS
jgi:hypothetical protein